MLVFFETCFRNFGENNNTMVFKINISSKDGKTYKLETETEELIGKKINDIIPGETLLANLNDYELKITGASDKAGFPYIKDLEGSELKRILLNYGKGMNKRPKKEGKKKRSRNRPKGLRLRKTVRGNTISSDTIQINLKVEKAGKKPLSEIFSEQAKGKSKENRKFKRANKKQSPSEEKTEEASE